MNKIRAALQRLPKRASAVATMIAAAIIVPATLLAWGPDRQTYTMEHPADHVVFNSITNNSAYGDERQFVQIKEAGTPNSSYSTNASLVAGKEYQVYVYYHNNAASNLNDAAHNYAGIAHGAFIRMAMPATVNSNTGATAYVGAANANPQQVWSDIHMTSANGSPVALRYVAGSAAITSFGAVNGKTLPDSIVTTGAPLGYNALDGNVPGCNEYAGYVTFRFKADQPNFEVTKQVREQGTTAWQKSVTTTPGKTVEYKLSYKNTGTTTQNNVVINDKLPAGMHYVAGSTVLVNANNPNGKTASDNITSGGINIGNYEPGANAFIRFAATVPAEAALQCNVTTKLTNTVTAETNNGNKSDTADVMTSTTCQPGMINVCNLQTKQTEKIKETDFNSSKYSKNLQDCVVPATPTAPVTPTELPHTGPTATIVSILGLGSLIAAGSYYVASRRALLGR